MKTTSQSVSVVILIFDDVEVLDFAGPFEVFSVASRLAAGPDRPPLAVKTCARAEGMVRARGGLDIRPGANFSNCEQMDVLVVPGGIVDTPLACEQTISWIADMATGATITASVCTGAFLLAEAGLLRGRRATTHWADAGAFALAYPDVVVESNRRYIEQDSVWTSAGVSAGIDMTLHIVANLFGARFAQETARQIDYPWTLVTAEQP